MNKDFKKGGLVGKYLTNPWPAGRTSYPLREWVKCNNCGKVTEIYFSETPPCDCQKKENAMRPELYLDFCRTTDISPQDKWLEYLSLGLCSEAGEVAGKIKKILRDNGGELDEASRKVVLKELGDCQWYIARLLDRFGSSFEEIMYMNYAKLQDRKIRGKLSGDGDER